MKADFSPLLGYPRELLIPVTPRMARNPFILQEAEEDDRDAFGPEDEDMDGDGGGSGDEMTDDDDGDSPYDRRDAPRWRDQDWIHADSLDLQDPFEDFTEHLKERYVDQGHRKAFPLDEDSLLSNQELKAALLDQGTHTALFWRIQCKAGKEQDLLFDIMNWALQHTPTPNSDQSGSSLDCASHQIPSIHHEDTPDWKAIVILEDFANDKYATLPQVHEELRKIYGSSYDEEMWLEFLAPINDREPDEPVDNSVLLKLAERKKALIPSSTSTSFPMTLTNPRWTTTTTADSGGTRAVDTASSSFDDRLLSAFCVPSVSSFVYLEADLGTRPEETNIVEFLQQHEFVVKSRVLRRHQKVGHSLRRVIMEPVFSREIGQLLSIQTPDIRVNSWVRVTRGTYSDDVGLVIRREISSSLRRLVILLVPRLGRTSDSNALNNAITGSKRKATAERPQQCLFDEKLYLGEVVRLGEKHFLFQSQEFSHGLLVKVLAYSSVTPVEVDLDRTSRQLFRVAGHPVVNQVAFPVPLDWLFFVEENVEVICLEKLREEELGNTNLPRNTYNKGGVILTVEEGRCLIGFEAEDDQQWVSTRNIRKRIMIGDSVVIAAGESTGKNGLVVANHGSAILVTETGQRAGNLFTVHPNVCRVTQVRDRGSIPWLNTHVTIFVGMYAGYTGVVTDVHMPRPNYPYTSLDVYIPRIITNVFIRHDFVFDTVSQRYLRDVHPLKSNQQHFFQVSWGTLVSPNVPRIPLDPGTNKPITVEHVFGSLPPVPWIGLTGRVIRGNHKGSAGTIKKAQRWDKTSSGIQLLIELDTWSYDKGTSPSYWFDYLDVRDPDTGLGFAERYPLRGRQRYWEPLKAAAPVKAQPIAIVNRRPHTPPPPPHNVYRDADAWNPSSHTPLRLFLPDESEAEGSTSHRGKSPALQLWDSSEDTLTSTTPAHWTLHPHLDHKKYLARYEPPNGPAVPRVWAELRLETGKVWIEPESDIAHSVPACQIFDHIPRVKPTTNRKPLLVVHGEHTGKHLRQIYVRYIDQEDTPKITAAVYGPWGSVEERLLEVIEVDANDVAEAQKDFNAPKFADEMKAMRAEARKRRQRGDKKKKKA
ncbi:hypothetical protein K435DRAFT_853605 [Dendrothele bispora CBS 962.96]|uniref:KOW domain-containing protein n=1 Tax=Dendrothele bispora (strain CBS 962.96) TaxID=1314807 RepID=A0A4S8MG06_DENBC|nr:hypothetical protein K435DRAFT_853605 [Dendrothele bispora CBS 962.96]